MRALKLPAVIEKTAISKATIYRGIQAGTFPRPIRLGPSSIAWLEHEIDEWLEARALERDTGAA